MKLTALEIKQQTFEKSLRGYDVAEVKAFLNIISNEWEHLVSRNKDLEREILQIRDKLKHYEKVEEALHETLQTAKESAEHRLEGARKDAKTKIEKAEMEAENILREARQQRQQIRQSVHRLLDRREEIIRGIRSYLELAQESLGSFTKDDNSIYSLPPEEQEVVAPPKKPVSTLKKEEKKAPVEKPQSSPAPGTEDLDDLIDEID